MESVSQKEIVSINPADVKIEDGNLHFSFKGKSHDFQLKKLTSRLAGASAAQLLNYTVSPSGYGIHWNEIDEDISFGGLLKKGN